MKVAGHDSSQGYCRPRVPISDRRISRTANHGGQKVCPAKAGLKMVNSAGLKSMFLSSTSTGTAEQQNIEPQNIQEMPRKHFDILRFIIRQFAVSLEFSNWPFPVIFAAAFTAILAPPPFVPWT